jgi:hypothetical protein
MFQAAQNWDSDCPETMFSGNIQFSNSQCMLAEVIYGRARVFYKAGQVPKVGDRIRDKRGALATVLSVQPRIGILLKWDENVVDLEYPCVDHFTLVSRDSD